MIGRDLVVFAALVVAFAALAVAHIALARAIGRHSRGEGLVAFFIPVAAPILALRWNLYVGAGIWSFFVAAYIVLLVLTG